MRFSYAPFGAAPAYDPALAIGCDGLPPARLCLSHWPGNATPRDLRRDLSTGIALAFASLPERERRERFGRLEVVANDHFDTDGMLAVFACLQPQAALARADAMLAAARAGDFWVAPSRRAVAVDLAIEALAEPAAALDRLPALLDDPFSAGLPIADELARVEEDLAWLRSGAVAVERRPALDLTIFRLSREVDPRAANEAASSDRVLELRPADGGTHAELRVSSESWFDLPSERCLPRPDLAKLADRLSQRERGGAAWSGDAATEAVARLICGVRSSETHVRRPGIERRPSSLSPEEIAAEVVAFLAEERG